MASECPIEYRLCLWCAHVELNEPGPVTTGAYTWDSGSVDCGKRHFPIFDNRPLSEQLAQAQICPDFEMKSEVAEELT